MGFRFFEIGIKKRRNGERMVPSRRIRHLGVVLMVVHVFGWMVWLCSMLCTGLFLGCCYHDLFTVKRICGVEIRITVYKQNLRKIKL
jgi:hypothetical protein